MNNNKQLKLIAILVLFGALASAGQLAFSRGGGGGGRGGGGRGGFDRGGGDRGAFGDFDRGFDNRDAGYYGRRDGNGDFDSRANNLADGARPEAPIASTPRVSDADLRAGADQEYHFGKTPALSTDAAFSHSTPKSTPLWAASSGELANRGNFVRSDFADRDAFNHDWWGNHPYAWRYPGYDRNDWAWGYCGWGDMCGFWGLPLDTDLPEYDYGNNITYQNNEVYYGTQPTATTEQYYDQAENLAETASPTSALVAYQGNGFSISPDTSSVPKNDSWKPLGVFSLTQGAQTNTTSIFQLAIDKKGIIRGNYENELTGDVKTVQGAVDKKSMRAAWTVGDTKGVIYDTGLSNLMKSQSTVLIHFSKSRTEQWTLVRLDAPTTPKKTT